MSVNNITDEYHEFEQFWEKDNRRFVWTLYNRLPGGNINEVASVTYAFFHPWSAEKIHAVIKKFGSAPADIIYEMPEDILEDLPWEIVDKLL